MEAPVPRRHRIAPYMLGLLTLVLTFQLAFQSSELHRVDLALREHQDLLRERPQDKLYQAWKKLYIEGVYTAPPASPNHMDDYQKLVDAARELADRRGAVVKLLIDASDLHLWPRSDDAVALSSQELLRAAAQPDCPSSPMRMAAVGGAPERDPFTRERYCFLASLGITAGDVDYPLWSHAYAARDKVNLLVAWLLPGLYGLLGACVALMRAELQRQAAAGVSVLAAVKLLYRLALGGLAGIIVGWFWSSGASGAAAAAATGVAAAAPAVVPPLSFGIAFLAGFSIERLFDLLDDLMNKLPGGRQPAS